MKQAAAAWKEIKTLDPQADPAYKSVREEVRTQESASHREGEVIGVSGYNITPRMPIVL